MGLLDFMRTGQWFGQDQPQGPTPLFPPGVTTDKQSLFPVASDKPPISPNPSGPQQSGWGAVSSWLNAPAYGDAAGSDPQGLMAYHPQSRLQAFGKALSAAGAGMLSQRGPYANPLGGALVGATQGLEQAREQDVEGRKAAFDAQAKQAQVALERVKALNEARNANKPQIFGSAESGYYSLLPDGTKQQVAAPVAKTFGSAEGGFYRDVPGDKPEQLVAPVAKPFGSAESGFFTMGPDGKPVQVTSGGMNPYQQAQVAQQQRQAAEAARHNRADEATAQLNAGAGKSADERIHNAALGYTEKMAKGEKLTPDELLDYRDKWKTLQEPKVTTDPATGVVTTVNPDLSHLTPPPGETVPTPGQQMQPTLPPREQMTKAVAASAAHKTFTETLGRVQSLLKDAPAGELLAGDRAARLKTESIALDSAMGAMQEAGVLQPSDIQRYKEITGPMTGLGAYVGKLVNYQPINAALNELGAMSQSKYRAALPRAMNEEDAKRMPKGVPFLLPDGSEGVN